MTILRRRLSNGKLRQIVIPTAAAIALATNPASSAPTSATPSPAASPSPAPTPTINATRFDVVLDVSAVAPGQAATGGVTPNSGPWSGSGSSTITLTPSSGPAITLTVPSNGNATIPFSLTPAAAGELLVAATNTAGLRNPAPAPLTVFSASSGASTKVTIGSLPGTYRAQRVFQANAWSGTALGFSPANGATLGRGWGKVKLPITAAVPALFARLTDADSAGATASGGGAAITNVAQVYGAAAAGATATLLLPVSDYCVYLDVAGDAAFTNPTRLSIPFFIRDNVLVITRSAWNMLWGSHANGIPGNTAWSSYTKTTGLGSQNPVNAGFETAANNSWGRADGVQTYGAYGQSYGGVGGQELGRLFAARKGTGLGVLGLVPTGGNMDSFWGADGTPCNSAVALMAAVDDELRYVVIESAGWDGSYATESLAEYSKLWAAIPGKLMDIAPSIAVIAAIADSGQYGTNGSQSAGAGAIGFARQNACIRAVELVNPCVVAVDANSDWNEYYTNSGHASWSSAIRYARAAARALLLAESTVAGGYGRGYADRNTTLAATGTLAGNVISIPYHLAAGATKIVPLRWQNHLASAAAWAYTAPSAADLCRLVAVYPGINARFVSTADTLIAISGVAINQAAGTVEITVPAGTSGPLTVQFLTDFFRQTAVDDTFWCGFFDDRDPGDGCGYGPGVRQQLDIEIAA